MIGSGRRKGRSRRGSSSRYPVPANHEGRGRRIVVVALAVLVVSMACGGHPRALAFRIGGAGRVGYRIHSDAAPSFLKAAERPDFFDPGGAPRPLKRSSSSRSSTSSSGRPFDKKTSLHSHPSSSLKFRDMQDMLDRLSNPNETLLIVFTASNCGPCKLQSKELSEFRQRLTNELAAVNRYHHGTDDFVNESTVRSSASPSEERDDNNENSVPLRMLAIDTAKWPHVGLRWFKVSKLPCVVVLRDKQVVARMEGLTLANELLEHVRPHLQVPPGT